jgi:hypothetical protein
MSWASFSERAERHPWIVLTCLVLTGSVGAAAVMQGPGLGFLHFTWAASAFLVSGSVALVGLLAALVVRLARGAWSKPLNIAAGMAAVCACGAASSVVAGIEMHRALVDETKEWAVAQIPGIERYREAQGQYPADLALIAGTDPTPRLVRNGDLHYSADRHGYRFDLHTGLISGWCWNSTERIWHYYD